MSDKNFSLINLDAASDIIIKFLDMIQDAVGWMVTPHGKRKDFEEALIMYKKSIEEDEKIDGIAKAAKLSSARKELKQYINQSKIIAYAIEDLDQNAKLEVEDDWLSYFFNYAQNISEESVQKIWAKILAEHCNGNSNVKKTLVHILSLLDKESAQAFGNLCRITIQLPKFEQHKIFENKFILNHVPLVLSPLDCCRVKSLNEIYKKDISTREYIECIPSQNNLIILQEIGLIELSNNADFEYPCSVGCLSYYKNEDGWNKQIRLKECVVSYGDDKYNIEPRNMEESELYELIKKRRKIKFGRVRYTTIGENLYKILNIEKINDLDIILEECVSQQGLHVRKI